MLAPRRTTSVGTTRLATAAVWSDDWARTSPALTTYPAVYPIGSLSESSTSIQVDADRRAPSTWPDRLCRPRSRSRRTERGRLPVRFESMRCHAGVFGQNASAEARRLPGRSDRRIEFLAAAEHVECAGAAQAEVAWNDTLFAPAATAHLPERATRPCSPTRGRRLPRTAAMASRCRRS